MPAMAKKYAMIIDPNTKFIQVLYSQKKALSSRAVSY
jgi:hypothetical protein